MVDTIVGAHHQVVLGEAIFTFRTLSTKQSNVLLFCFVSTTTTTTTIKQNKTQNKKKWNIYEINL
jgi:hypothetical protein